MTLGELREAIEQLGLLPADTPVYVNYESAAYANVDSVVITDLTNQS